MIGSIQSEKGYIRCIYPTSTAITWIARAFDEIMDIDQSEITYPEEINDFNANVRQLHYPVDGNGVPQYDQNEIDDDVAYDARQQ